MNYFQLKHRGMGKDRIHITNGVDHKFIDRNDNIPDGWRQGHSDKSIQKMRDAKLGKTGVNKGRSWYHNEITGESKMFLPDDDRLFLEDGWVKGRSKSSTSKKVIKLVNDAIEIGGDLVKEHIEEVTNTITDFSGTIDEIYSYLTTKYESISQSVISKLSVVLQSIINRKPHGEGTKWISLKNGKTKRINKDIEYPHKGALYDKPRTQFVSNSEVIYGRIYDYENSIYKEPGKYYTEDLGIGMPNREIDSYEYDIYRSIIELATVL